MKKVDGVKSAEPDFEYHKITVVFDDSKTSLDALKESLKKAGFPPEGEPTAVK
ncbi:MAG TPA: cation transporter [Syntrophobacteria bacterium]|nr:cation transporter [Syntrophobacteria bacterium]